MGRGKAVTGTGSRAWHLRSRSLAHLPCLLACATHDPLPAGMSLPWPSKRQSIETSGSPRGPWGSELGGTMAPHECEPGMLINTQQCPGQSPTPATQWPQEIALQQLVTLVCLGLRGFLLPVLTLGQFGGTGSTGHTRLILLEWLLCDLSPHGLQHT